MSIWDQSPLEYQLRTLVAQGKSGGEIAKILKISRNAVIGKANRLGIGLHGETPRRPSTKRQHFGKTPMGGQQSRQFAEPSAPRRMSWDTSE